jgi:DNA-binding FadR family transcriptional regulator
VPEDSAIAVIRRPEGLVESIRKQSVLLARDIANFISDRDLDEGTKLPNEQEMLVQFGVGRNTIREALRILEMRGVITIRSGRGGGPIVRRPRKTDLSEALQLVLQFQHATLHDVIEARLLIEPLAASAAAAAITAEEQEQLRLSVELMRANPEDEVLFTQQNNLFHSVVGSCLHSPVIGVFLDSLKSVQDGVAYGVRYSPVRVKNIAKAHEQIIDQIAKKDSAGAAAAMHRHLNDARKYWATKFPQVSNKNLRWLGD